MSFVRVCPACHARNLIERFEIRREARCGACKHRLQEPLSVRLMRVPYRNPAWILLFTVVGLWLGKDPFWTALGVPVQQAASSPAPLERHTNVPGPLPSASAPPKVVDPDAGLIPVPVAQGVLYRQNGREFIAPLSVTTPTGNERYYAKLVSVATNETVLTFMMDAGTTFRTKAPLGQYRLRYATGVTWYGPTHLFGARTEYFEAEHTFDFRINGDQIAGFRIELVKQINGNLQTARISPNQF